MARPPMPWVGNKEKLLPYIHSILPPKYSQYLEPFGGSGAMLLSLPHRSSRLDIYNDFNNDLTNLFLCIRDKPLVLLRELGFLPFHSRAEFDMVKKLVSHEKSFAEIIDEELEVIADRLLVTEEQAAELEPILRGKAEMYDAIRAAAYLKRAWGSFSGTITSFGLKVIPFEKVKERVNQIVKRLPDVVIENRNAIRLIAERDREDGVTYCDPPYFEAEKIYQVEFPKRMHVKLWRVLKQCKGYVIVSYNDCPYIRNLYKDFYIYAFERPNSMSQKACSKYGEVLITNYDPREFKEQLDLFGEPVDLGRMRLVHAPRKPLKAA